MLWRFSSISKQLNELQSFIRWIERRKDVLVCERFNNSRASGNLNKMLLNECDARLIDLYLKK